MQALVSFDYTFMDVYIGWPGIVHDARVITNSRIFQEAEAGSLFPNITKSINGQDIPLLVVGDPAYRLLPWLMKPYSFMHVGSISHEHPVSNPKDQRLFTLLPGAPMHRGGLSV